MKRRELTKKLSAALFAPFLLGCNLRPANSKTDDLPSFDDLVGYIKDGTFTERYIPKPHKAAHVANVGDTYFTHDTPNAAAEFARYFRLHPDAHLSGVSLYTNNEGGVPYEERSKRYHPDTYRGAYFRYVCPVSDNPCQYDPARIERINPKEWNDELWNIGGEGDTIFIPISDYEDDEHRAATLTVGRTKYGGIFGFNLSKARALGPFDISARIIGRVDGVVVRSISYDFVGKKMEIRA